MILSQSEDCVGGACNDPAPFWGFGTTSYKVLLVMHIIGVVVAFGPTLVYAALGREAKKRSGSEAQAFAGLSAALHWRVSMPALLFTALSGVLLVIASKQVFRFEQAWISAAFTIVIVLLLIGYFVLRPAQEKIVQLLGASGSDSGDEPDVVIQDAMRRARTSAAIATGFVHMGLVLLVILMVWKPS